MCLRVCLSVSMEIQTAGRIRMKFGMEVVLKGGKVLGGMGCVKGVRRYRSLSHSFWHLKQKLQGAPDLVGAGDLFGEFIKSMLKCLSLIAIWSGLRLPKLTPGVQGAQKGGSWASAMRFG